MNKSFIKDGVLIKYEKESGKLRLSGGSWTINMDKIKIVTEDDGDQEATLTKIYNKLIMAKLDEIVDWINSQG